MHLGVAPRATNFPLWLVMIGIGFAAVQSHLIRPEYFTDFQLFPSWPRFDVELHYDLALVQYGGAVDPERC